MGTGRDARRSGHSLVELLICIAIISILMALYLPVLSKARLKAVQVAGGEALRQEHIGAMADSANSPNAPRNTPTTFPDRAACRAAYVRKVSTHASEQTLVTQILYEVRTEPQFRAYWHTLINLEATDPLEFEDGFLVARDENSNEHRLRPMTPAHGPVQPAPYQWDLFSTSLADTSRGSLGINVQYTDGHVRYVRYPGEFPACVAVAELTHRYLRAFS